MGSEEEYSESQWNISKNYGDLSRFTTIEIDIYRQHGPKFIEIFEISIGVALQVIEYLKAAEIVFQRLATLDDIATVSGQKKATHSTNVNKLVKKQILTKFHENGRVAFAPHPRFYKDGQLPENVRISVAYTSEDSSQAPHLVSSEVSKIAENTLNVSKPLAQVANRDTTQLMSDYMLAYEALRDEVWETCEFKIPDREAQRLVTYVHQMLLLVTPRNQWVLRLQMIKELGYSDTTATRMPRAMHRYGLLEIDQPRGKVTTRYRLDVDFYSRWQSRLSALGLSHMMEPRQPAAPSSSAPSTSDNPPA